MSKEPTEKGEYKKGHKSGLLHNDHFNQLTAARCKEACEHPERTPPFVLAYWQGYAAGMQDRVNSLALLDNATLLRELQTRCQVASLKVPVLSKVVITEVSEYGIPVHTNTYKRCTVVVVPNPE